jgi:hypothetical protein
MPKALFRTDLGVWLKADTTHNALGSNGGFDQARRARCAKAALD